MVTQNNEFILNFLKKNLLGQGVNADDKEQVIKKCISLAYKDMMTAGMYFLDKDLGKSDKEKTKRNNERKEKFYKILVEKNFEFSRGLIKDTCAIFGENEKIENSKSFATRYGLSQKLVNMTFKYLYVFDDLIGMSIDYSNCDCPIDSIIIDKKLNQKGKFVWSKLKKEEYEELQKKIYEKVNLEKEYKNLGRLLYDFLNW